jgi:hypothetical protein
VCYLAADGRPAERIGVMVRTRDPLFLTVPFSCEDINSLCRLGPVISRTKAG